MVKNGKYKSRKMLEIIQYIGQDLKDREMQIWKSIWANIMEEKGT